MLHFGRDPRGATDLGIVLVVGGNFYESIFNVLSMTESVFWRGTPGKLVFSTKRFLINSIAVAIAFVIYHFFGPIYLSLDIYGKFSLITNSALAVVFLGVPGYQILLGYLSRKKIEYAITSAGIFEKTGSSVNTIQAVAIRSTVVEGKNQKKSTVSVFHGVPEVTTKLINIENPYTINKLIFQVREDSAKNYKLPDDISSLISPTQDFFGLVNKSLFSAKDGGSDILLYVPVKTECDFVLSQRQDATIKNLIGERDNRESDLLFFKQKYEIKTQQGDVFTTFRNSEIRKAVLSASKYGCSRIELTSSSEVDSLGSTVKHSEPHVIARISKIDITNESITKTLKAISSIVESLPMVHVNEKVIASAASALSQIESRISTGSKAAERLIQESIQNSRQTSKAVKGEKLEVVDEAAVAPSTVSPQKLAEKLEKIAQEMETTNNLIPAVTAEPELIKVVSESRKKTAAQTVRRATEPTGKGDDLSDSPPSKHDSNPDPTPV